MLPRLFWFSFFFFQLGIHIVNKIENKYAIEIINENQSHFVVKINISKTEQEKRGNTNYQIARKISLHSLKILKIMRMIL
jgi:hypothetical protein